MTDQQNIQVNIIIADPHNPEALGVIEKQTEILKNDKGDILVIQTEENLGVPHRIQEQIAENESIFREAESQIVGRPLKQELNQQQIISEAQTGYRPIPGESSLNTAGFREQEAQMGAYLARPAPLVKESTEYFDLPQAQHQAPLAQPKITVNTTEVIYDQPIPVEHGPTLTDKLGQVMKEKLAEAKEFTKEEFSIAKDVAKQNLPLVMEMTKDGLVAGLQTTSYLAHKGLEAAKEGIQQAVGMMNCGAANNSSQQNTYYVMQRAESGFSDRELQASENEMPQIDRLSISEQPKFHFDNKNHEVINKTQPEQRLEEIRAAPTMLGSDMFQAPSSQFIQHKESEYLPQSNSNINNVIQVQPEIQGNDYYVEKRDTQVIIGEARPYQESTCSFAGPTTNTVVEQKMKSFSSKNSSSSCNSASDNDQQFESIDNRFSSALSHPQVQQQQEQTVHYLAEPVTHQQHQKMPMVGKASSTQVLGEYAKQSVQSAPQRNYIDGFNQMINERGNQNLTAEEYSRLLDDYLRNTPITCSAAGCQEHHRHGLQIKQSDAGFNLQEINHYDNNVVHAQGSPRLIQEQQEYRQEQNFEERDQHNVLISPPRSKSEIELEERERLENQNLEEQKKQNLLVDYPVEQTQNYRGPAQTNIVQEEVVVVQDQPAKKGLGGKIKGIFHREKTQEQQLEKQRKEEDKLLRQQEKWEKRAEEQREKDMLNKDKHNKKLLKKGGGVTALPAATGNQTTHIVPQQNLPQTQSQVYSQQQPHLISQHQTYQQTQPHLISQHQSQQVYRQEQYGIPHQQAMPMTHQHVHSYEQQQQPVYIHEHQPIYQQQQPIHVHQQHQQVQYVQEQHPVIVQTQQTVVQQQQPLIATHQAGSPPIHYIDKSRVTQDFNALPKSGNYNIGAYNKISREPGLL